MTKTFNIRLDHINLTVKNLDESLTWYQKIFGFEKVEEGTSEGEPWAIIRKGDTMLALYQEQKRKKVPESDPVLDQFHRIYHFGLQVDSKEAWEESVATNKVNVTYGGAIRYPHSYSWYVEDPNGHEIEVSYWDQNKVVF